MIQNLLSHPYLQSIYWGNTLGEYVIALVVFFGILIVLGIFKKVILARLRVLARKSSTDIDDVLIAIVSEIHPPFYSFISFYIALQLIIVTGLIKTIITTILYIWATYLIIRMVRIFINRIIRKRLGEDDGNAQAAIQLLTAVFTFVLWILGILLLLQNLGINVTSLIAGLGIGGIAVALALQNVLSDLFSSFSILFDKPFTVGDYIDTGSVSGTVEKIGIKTTRLRASSGEQVIVSNAELTSTSIQNYKRMEERRMVFTIGVTYETPSNVLREIPHIVKQCIESEDGTLFKSTHFKEFGDSAYIYETIYYVTSPDYYEYLSIHDSIGMKIIDAFAGKNIDMAYPTQRVYMSDVKGA